VHLKKQSQFAGQWPEIRKFERVRLKNKPNVNMGKIVLIGVNQGLKKCYLKKQTQYYSS